MILKFEDHKNIVWFCYEKIKPNLPKYDEWDWYQIGCIALNKAIDLYDKDKGKFSPFAVMLISNAWYNEIKKSGRQKRVFDNSLLSLDKCYNEQGVTLGHLLVNYEDPEKVLESEEKYNHIMNCVVTEEHRLYIKCILQQLSQEEISNILGISQATVSNNIKDFKALISDTYYERSNNDK